MNNHGNKTSLPMSQETSRGNVLTVLWFQQMETDKTFPDNKPDTIVRDNEKRPF